MSAAGTKPTALDVLQWIRVVRLRLQTASECFDELGEQVLASETHQAYLYLERVAEFVSDSQRPQVSAPRDRGSEPRVNGGTRTPSSRDGEA